MCTGRTFLFSCIKKLELPGQIWFGFVFNKFVTFLGPGLGCLLSQFWIPLVRWDVFATRSPLPLAGLTQSYKVLIIDLWQKVATRVRKVSIPRFLFAQNNFCSRHWWLKFCQKKFSLMLKLKFTVWFEVYPSQTWKNVGPTGPRVAEIS